MILNEICQSRIQQQGFTLAADYQLERKGSNPRKYFISISITGEFNEVRLREAHSYWIYRMIHPAN